MARIEPVVFVDSGLEILQGLLIFSLAARDSAESRLDVSPADVIVSRGQNLLAFLQNAHGGVISFFLKSDPGLDDLHDRSHHRILQFEGEFFAAHDVRKRVAITPGAAVTAANGKIGDSNELLIADFALER